jgi:hypothetical protein
LDEDWNDFGDWFFWDRVQRRGADVNTPKNGSRDGQMCFGGISEIHADLRRELFRGNLKLVFFWGLFGFPRGGTEEGGPMVCNWGNFGQLKGFS